jgi:hypothetical protein
MILYEVFDVRNKALEISNFHSRTLDLKNTL